MVAKAQTKRGTLTATQRRQRCFMLVLLVLPSLLPAVLWFCGRWCCQSMLLA
jgi:hypothetical protein